MAQNQPDHNNNFARSLSYCLFCFYLVVFLVACEGTSQKGITLSLPASTTTGIPLPTTVDPHSEIIIHSQTPHPTATRAFTPGAKKPPTSVATLTASAPPFPTQVVPYDHAYWNEYLTIGVPKHEIGEVYDITLAPDGALWFAGMREILSFDGKTWKSYPYEDEADNRYINRIAVDSHGNIWTGNAKTGKIARYDRQRWEVFSNNIPISSIVTDRNGSVWIGTQRMPSSYPPRGLLHYKDGDWEEFTDFKDVTYVGFDTQGSLWCATIDALYHFDGKQWQAEPFIPSIGPKAFAPDGALWLIHAGELQRYQNGRQTHYINKLFDAKVLRVAYDDSVWIGAFDCGGRMSPLMHFDGQTLTSFDALPFCIVYDILSTPDGSIWLGTEGGIYRYNP